MSNDISFILNSLQETVNWMGEKLSSVSADVEMIKRNYQSQQVAQPSERDTPDEAHSAQRTHSVTPSEVPHNNDTIIMRLYYFSTRC